MKLKKAISDKLAARSPEKALPRARALLAEGEASRAFKLFAVAAGVEAALIA